MGTLHRSAVGGLLWLAFSTAAFATTLTITGHPETIPVGGGGGEFTAFLNSNSNSVFNVFCVDYRNFITGIPDTYNVNVDILPNISDARYSGTLDASFSFYKGAGGDPNGGSAENRYLLAAWLITQYSFPGGSVTATDNAIQDAIWNLLDVDGADNNLGSTDALVKAQVQNAVNWEASQTLAQLNAFASRVEIFSDVLIDSSDRNCSSRYSCGQQEYLTVLSTPEPSVLLLVGSGLLCLGLLRFHKS